ncbi:MAG: hypothetical protein JWM74_1140 [Myxococcaceae bacterium]|nr:hypothetical protein [Myxococcaceae bacterium]
MGMSARATVLGLLIVLAACAPRAPDVSRAAPAVKPAAPAAVVDASIALSPAENNDASAPPAALPEVAPEGPPTIGLDDAPGTRRRVPTAVILLGTRGLKEDEPLRFQPVLCVIEGKLTTGLACGKAMPARPRVRTTRVDPKLPAVLTLARNTRDYFDDGSQATYRAPVSPACCMYNTCVGETIPFLAPKGVKTSETAVLAIWPEDADVGLRPRGPGGDAAGVVVPASREKSVLRQVLREGNQALASGSSPARCRSCAFLLSNEGAGWKAVKTDAMGAGTFDVIATADMDADGHAEALVYESWSNDFGFLVLGNDWKTTLYEFSCGNI